MKVKLLSYLHELFDDDPFGVEVEIPDGVMREYRRLRKRLSDLAHDIGCEYWPAREVWEEKQTAKAEARRDEIRKATLMRQQTTPHTEITEQSREQAGNLGSDLMRQYVMTLDGEMPRGIVYADSPLRKKDDAD